MNAPEGEFGGVGALCGSEARMEFLRRTHLCRFEEEERDSLLRAMLERDITSREGRRHLSLV